ncbi:MAG: endonuclease domain-containing protein [Actinomycetota bacterium]
MAHVPPRPVIGDRWLRGRLVVLRWDLQGRDPGQHEDDRHESRPDRTAPSYGDREVRGLLCFNCSGALGRFDDEPSVLEAAIAYLLSHGATGG